ncbi:MAG: hypothetical protein K2J93_06130 [Anaeroplasmataceae bacterium]|nr:hypothetical protein [Anaeroplasmataceae bacterium]
MTNEALRKIHRICNIILSCITFLLTILTLAQFIYVRNLYYFIISFLVHLGIVFIYHVVFHVINKKRGFIIIDKGKEVKIIWIVMYFIRVISCCVILLMIHIGNLFEVEEVALAKDPYSITYMVFVFVLLFLEFFSIFVRIIEKSEQKV